MGGGEGAADSEAVSHIGRLVQARTTRETTQAIGSKMIGVFTGC